jgi:hypothetical protein
MIIGISGKMQSGKNTVASIINQLTNNMFVEKAFADKLKECVSIITGIPRADLEKEEVKNSYLGDEWNRIESMTVRTLLQEFGTEVGRQIHPDTWVNALFSEYDNKGNENYLEKKEIEISLPIHIGTTTKRQEKTKFKCSCGKVFISTLWRIETGHTKSCGCLQKQLVKAANLIHGDSNTRLYSIYKNMKTRCYNENGEKYDKYGGKGIIVCDDWLSSYSNFKKWALNNGYNDTLSLDRIKTDGNYEPINCRWIKLEDQLRNKDVYSNNKLSINGVSLISSTGKYRAQIQYKGEKFNLGSFDTPEEASKIYESKRIELFKIKNNTKNWIITDLRFENEFKAVKDRGGINIRVNRNKNINTRDHSRSYLSHQNIEHPSETALDYATFDYTIDNNGTIEELIVKVKEILIKEKIL